MMCAPVKKWVFDTAATAAVEFTLIFPLLMTMMLGVFELSNAISVNQRSIAASQIIADLIARKSTVTEDMVDEAIRAGELAVEPYSLAEMGVDIVSLEFDENDEPQVVWRETRNMTENDDVLDRSVGLGVNGDGAMIVTVQYLYRPYFGSMVINEFTMQELAFSRGRRSPVVVLNEDPEEP